MNLYFIPLSVVLIFSKPNHQPDLTPSAHQHQLTIDTSRLAVLNPEKNVLSNYFNEGAKPAVLSPDEIEKVEVLITEAVTRYNTDSEKIYKQNQINTKKYPGSVAYNPGIKSFAGFYKQLIAVINTRGEKEVWVNCFCKLDDWRPNNDKNYWRKNIVRVMDGGSCYFNLKINLTTGTIDWFKVNGVA